MSQDLFGVPLVPDLRVALHPITVNPRRTPGPVRNQQYVIELVGPRTVPAPSIKFLLDQQWQSALGQPQIFVMSGGDSFWRPLDANDKSGAYDSVALAWDLISPKGSLNATSAQHLFGVADNLAKQLERRAMPLPVPADVDLYVRALEEVRASLDIGVNLSVVAEKGPFPEAEVWKACTALGLQFGPTGLFEWHVPGWEGALLGVCPGELDAFSLGQVQKGVEHESLSIGFSVPLSPAPMQSLEACFHVGEVLSQGLQAQLLDDNDDPATAKSLKQMQSNLDQAVKALAKAGFPPGSTEALKLFGS